MHRLFRERFSAHRFELNRIVKKDVVDELLSLTLTAPTSFNIQPYVGILVDGKQRQHLSKCMLGGNARKVKDSSFSIVFASDLEPSKRVPSIEQLEKDAGRPDALIGMIAPAIRLFANEGAVASGLKCAMSSLLSPVVAVPNFTPTIAWSYKQTMMAASTYILAAKSLGLDTCAMEGFDETKVKNALGIPDRYSVPVVIATGYAKKDDQDIPAPRLPKDVLFAHQRFGNGFL